MLSLKQEFFIYFICININASKCIKCICVKSLETLSLQSLDQFMQNLVLKGKTLEFDNDIWIVAKFSDIFIWWPTRFFKRNYLYFIKILNFYEIVNKVCIALLYTFIFCSYLNFLSSLLDFKERQLLVDCWP